VGTEVSSALSASEFTGCKIWLEDIAQGVKWNLTTLHTWRDRAYILKARAVTLMALHNDNRQNPVSLLNTPSRVMEHPKKPFPPKVLVTPEALLDVRADSSINPSTPIRPLFVI
jgi:hypothetical protein